MISRGKELHMIPSRALLMALFALLAQAAWAAESPAAAPAEIKIGPDTPTVRNEFGNSVAIDGQWAVIGDQVDDYGDVPSGAAYVFRRIHTGWIRVAKLTSSVEDDAFGLSVDISGSTIVVGAWGDNFGKGAAYVFERTRGTDEWTLTAKLTAADPVPGELFGDRFGFSVAIDKKTIVVGAPLGDTVIDDNTGAAFVFEKGPDDKWVEVQKLWPADASRGMQFGESVDVSTCRVLVGAPWATGVRFQSGAAYVFDSCGDSGWQETARVAGDDLDNFFGTSVAIDRGTAVVGANANNEHGVFTGAAYVFEENAGGADAWGRVASLAAFDPKQDKNFGYSVGIHGDTVVVGAPGDDHTGFSAGAAYIFRRDAGGGDGFGPVGKLTASDSSFGSESFGWDVDVSESTVLVGAPSGGVLPFSGAAYLFPIPKREPVCRVSGDARGEGLRLDFRLGTPFPVEWSVWAWIAGGRHHLWTTPLGSIDPSADFSVPLPGLDSLGRIWFLSVLSTSEYGIVCADWDRLNTSH